MLGGHLRDRWEHSKPKGPNRSIQNLKGLTVLTQSSVLLQAYIPIPRTLQRFAGMLRSCIRGPPNCYVYL